MANVRDSDATLVVIASAFDAGADRTIAAAREASKPCLVVDLAWLAVVQPRVLNIAGPRESSAHGIYARAAPFLLDLLRHVVVDDDLHQRSGL